MFVLQFPLLRITLFFIAGILFAQLGQPSFYWTPVLLLIGFCGTLLSFLGPQSTNANQLPFGFCAAVTAFGMGAFTLLGSVETRHTNHYSRILSKGGVTARMELTILEKLKPATGKDRYFACVDHLGRQKGSGKVLLNVAQQDGLLFEVGDILWVEGQLSPTAKLRNPGQFDYGQYLGRQQVYAQVYADPACIKKAGTKKTLPHFAGKLRSRIINNLARNNFGKDELAVLSALILGQQQAISREVARDYQFAGAVHLLSVSGLHVGLVIFFVGFLLKPLPNSGKWRLIKLFVVIASLWSFGILAGLAPSVVRSVTMFSFVAVGMFLRRSVNIYNTLVLSALLILLCRPSFLFDIGFQLSYLALFFIVWLQPFLSGIWHPKNKIIRYFWEIITVSFAAQLGTLPLSIYYFHQFPGLFFVTNLIVLPLLGIIMAAGVLLMILAAFDWVWLPLMKLVEWLIGLLNKIVSWVATFESFVLKDIPLNAELMLLAYALLLAATFWLMRPVYRRTVVLLCTLTLLQLGIILTMYCNQQEEELIVFHNRKNTLLTCRKSNEIVAYTNKKTNRHLLKPYVVAHFGHFETKPIQQLYYFRNTKILLIDSLLRYKLSIKPDVVILTASPKLNLDRFLHEQRPGQVVATAANFKSYVQRWKLSCQKEKIPFHDISEKGFYTLD